MPSSASKASPGRVICRSRRGEGGEHDGEPRRTGSPTPPAPRPDCASSPTACNRPGKPPFDSVRATSRAARISPPTDVVSRRIAVMLNKTVGPYRPGAHAPSGLRRVRPCGAPPIPIRESVRFEIRTARFCGELDTFEHRAGLAGLILYLTWGICPEDFQSSLYANAIRRFISVIG